MNNNSINKRAIKKIALALAELNDAFIYVGGATIGLYINDPAADDVRPTNDIDLSLSIASIGELELMREELTKKGFIQTSEDQVICRFRFEDIKVDIMNTKAIGWAPANPWFAQGFALKEKVDIENIAIQILPLPYFLAAKFDAFNSRGNNEPRTSHDFEDIVYVLDNRMDVTDVLLLAPQPVKLYLKKEFKKMIADPIKQEAILGNLNYNSREIRFEKLILNLKILTQDSGGSNV